MAPPKKRAAHAGGTKSALSTPSKSSKPTATLRPSSTSRATLRPATSSTSRATLRPIASSTPSLTQLPRTTRSMTAARSVESPILSGDRVWATNQDLGPTVGSTPTKGTRLEDGTMSLGSPALSDTASWAMMSSSSRYFDAVSRLDEDEDREKVEELGDFHRFPKLPGEIQLMIWKIAVNNPRIVGLKPEKIPYVAHACHDSRELSKIFFRIYDFKTGIFLNPKTDILLIDESSFSKEIGYHNSGLHTLRCNNVPKDTFTSVERVAFSIREVTRIWRMQCFHCVLTKKMPFYFPSIKELIIIVRPGPLGSGYEDLYETEPSADHTHTDDHMKQIKTMFEWTQEKPGSSKIIWKDIKLKFMRLEKWVK